MNKMFKSIKNKVKRGVREWCESEGCEVDMEGLNRCETFSELEEWGREVSNEFEGFEALFTSTGNNENIVHDCLRKFWCEKIQHTLNTIYNI